LLVAFRRLDSGTLTDESKRLESHVWRLEQVIVWSHVAVHRRTSAQCRLMAGGDARQCRWPCRRRPSCVVSVRDHRGPYDRFAAPLLVHRMSWVVHRGELGDRPAVLSLFAGVALRPGG